MPDRPKTRLRRGRALSRTEALIILGLAFGTCVSNGFARFAYGLILPAMQADLGWSYTQAGWINTANSLGYLIGAVLTLPLIARVPQQRLFVWGFAACAAALVASGLTRDFWWLSFWRVLSGVFGAPVFITAGALAASLSTDPRKSATAIALTFGGGGLALVLSGATLPGWFAAQGPASWPVTWIALGVVSFAMLPLGIWTAQRVEAVPLTLTRAPLPIRPLAPVLVAYFMFATGYIVYLTFLVAWMRVQGASPALISVTWVIVGGGTIVSGFLWKGVIGRARGGGAVVATLICIAAGTVIPVIWPTPAGLIGSAIVFGLSVFMCPTAVTSVMRATLSPDLRGRAMALLTIVFATGQCIGPVAAGAIGDAFGSIAPGLVAAAAILLIGAVAGLIQPRQATD